MPALQPCTSMYLPWCNSSLPRNVYLSERLLSEQTVGRQEEIRQQSRLLRGLPNPITAFEKCRGCPVKEVEMEKKTFCNWCFIQFGSAEPRRIRREADWEEKSYHIPCFHLLELKEMIAKVIKKDKKRVR